MASAQFGVVSRAQLLAFGVGEDAVQTWLDDGRLHRMFQGVYVVGHRALHPRARMFAAVLASGDGAAVSHASAAHLWGLRSSRARVVDLTVPDRSGRRQPGIRIHRPRLLGPQDVELVEGISCTTVARTLVDLAGAVAPPALERAVEKAEYLDVLDLRALADVLTRVKRPRGVRHLRRALGPGRLDAAPAGSELERAFLRLIVDAGVPRPVLQAPFELRDGVRIRADFHWPARGLVVEVDGPHHALPLQARRDARRDAALRALGLRVHRVTHDELEERPEAVLLAVTRLLSRSEHPARAER